MEYKLSEQELKDLMHRSWLQGKKFYSGKTDEYFYDYFEIEKKQLPIHVVVGRSEQLICDTCKSGLINCPDIYRRTCSCGSLGCNFTD